MQKCTKGFATYCLLGLLEMPLYFKYDGAAAVFLIGCRIEGTIKEFLGFEATLLTLQGVSLQNDKFKNMSMVGLSYILTLHGG